jgi:hypothetical protein
MAPLKPVPSPAMPIYPVKDCSANDIQIPLSQVKMTVEKIKLNTGAGIPIIGLGTWQSAPGEVKNAMAYALKTGYRHIDCAFCYANEDEVGEGLREAFNTGINREDVFVTTKLWATFSSRVEEGLDLSLKSLGLKYVDPYLVHWPIAMNPNGKHCARRKQLAASSYTRHRQRHPVSLGNRTVLEILISPGRTRKRGSRWRGCWRQAQRERSVFATTA